MDKDNALQAALNAMLSHGASGLKIECEAQMNRGTEDVCDNCYEGSDDCNSCETRGELDCGDCDGNGSITEEGVSHDCATCHGSGNVTCTDCDGRGYVTCDYCHGDWERSGDRFTSSGECLDFILDRLAQLTNETVQAESQSTDWHEGHEAFNPFSWLRYAQFYNDGSVDSELTFTVPLDSIETLKKVPLVLQAFRDLGAELDCMDVSGAGLHTSVLFTPDAVFPGESVLSNTRVQNFKKSMVQLLPALYFLGTHNEYSRSLSYREPRISSEGSKYSAIYYNSGALEFRVFDTCYDHPEDVLDNIVVIGNSMKYLNPTYVNPGLNKIASRIGFGNNNSRDLERLYSSVTHLELLTAGLRLLKPDYYSLRDLRKQRKFNRTKRTFSTLEKRWVAEAETSYREYEDRQRWALIWKEQDFKAKALKTLIETTAPQALQGLNTAELDRIAESKAKERLEAEKRAIQPKEAYIPDAVEKKKYNFSSCSYTLQLA